MLADVHVPGADRVGDQSFDASRQGGRACFLWQRADTLDGDFEIVREHEADGVPAA